MALKKTVVTPQGFDAPGAYHRVHSISISEKTSMTFTVLSFKESPSAAAFEEAVYSCPYDSSPEAAGPFAQAYAHLKTLPTFSGAIDV